jgi:hypothetical protein
MLVDENIICPKLKYFYYLLKGSSLASVQLSAVSFQQQQKVR